MIKSLQKDDVNAVPFVVSKNWRATSKLNPNLIIIDTDFEYSVETSNFTAESGEYFVSQSGTDSFRTEAESVNVVGYSTKSLALEFIDHGDGWLLSCDSSLITTSSNDILLEVTSSGSVLTEAFGDSFWLENSSDLAVSREPYNGPPYRYDLSADTPYTNSSCDLCLEQNEYNFITIEEGYKINNSIKFNPNLEQKNLNDTYKRITYNQVKNLFYNDSNDPTKILGLENLDIFLDAKNRLIFDKVKVITIPQAYFGDRIIKNSVEIIDDNGDQEYTIVDDGNGNLYAKEKLFSIIIEDENKNLITYHSSSVVNFSGADGFSLNDGVSTLNWQYYSTNSLYINRDHVNDFFVYAYDRNSRVTPTGYQCNLIYVGETGQNSNLLTLPHQNLLGYFRKIECGEDFVVALKLHGEVVNWGSSSFISNLPVFNEEVSDIAVGYRHAIALGKSGRLYVWGDVNYTGSLPTGSSTFSKITAGPSGSVVVGTNGSIYGFGHSSATLFSSIPQISNVSKIAIGSKHGMILNEDGNLFSWGVDSTYSQSNIPSSALSNVVDVKCGDDHTIVLKSDGTVITWGKNITSQSFVPFGSPETSWPLVTNATASYGLANVGNIYAKGNRSGVDQRRDSDESFKPSRFYLTWGEHACLTEYGLVDIHLGKNYTIFDPNIDYQKLNYSFDHLSPTVLGGSINGFNDLTFGINLKDTNEYSVVDKKVKLPTIHVRHGAPMFSGLGYLCFKDKNKEIHSYIATGSVNELEISTGLKSLFLGDDNSTLNDPHYGGYRGAGVILTRLTSDLVMGQTGSRDYTNRMIGTFLGYDSTENELRVDISSTNGGGTYDKWAIDFKRVITSELITELNLNADLYDRFYLKSGSLYTTSSNYNDIVSDELFINQYIHNHPSYNPYE